MGRPFDTAPRSASKIRWHSKGGRGTAELGTSELSGAWKFFSHGTGMIRIRTEQSRHEHDRGDVLLNDLPYVAPGPSAPALAEQRRSGARRWGAASCLMGLLVSATQISGCMGSDPVPSRAGSNSGGGSGSGAGGTSDGPLSSGGAKMGMEGDSSGGAGANANSGTGAESGTGGARQVVGTIDDLTIEPNERSALSAYASWATPSPSNSVVQFEAAGRTFEIIDDELVTEHRVLLIGLRAETEYMIRAFSTNEGGTLEGTSTYTTGALPEQIPQATISVSDPSKMQPGWTLMNVQKGDGTNRALSGAPPAAVIYDEEGYPVWYFIYGSSPERGGAISVDRTDRGVILGPTLSGGMGQAFPPIEVDWAGETVWTCQDPLCGVPDQLSHHAAKLSNGHYVVMRDASLGTRISQIFVELSPDSTSPVFELGLEDLMDPPAGANGDWAHGNSITIDLEQDIAYLSFRWLGVMKVRYSSKELLWHLPASYGENALGMFGDMQFDPPSSQFSDIHDPEIHEDGTLLVFDNGGYSGVIEDGNPRGYQTRAVEYAIDEETSTATLIWEWPGSYPVDAWYTSQLYVPFWGDADRLENGNVLITAGRRGTDELTPESRVIEVTKAEGEVVWELRLPKDHGIYRAERLTSLPRVRRL